MNTKALRAFRKEYGKFFEKFLRYHSEDVVFFKILCYNQFMLLCI